MIDSRQNGNILFLILIAVALFAALGYAVTNSSRSGKTDISNEKAQLSSAVGDSCTAAVNGGLLRLQTPGTCSESQISYEQPNGTNPNPNAPLDKRCHIFHPAGGGVAPCGGYIMGDNPCMATLSIGASCNNVIYAGVFSGRRLYTTKTNQGSFTWSSNAVYSVTGSTSANGLANTNLLMAFTGAGSPFPAAAACRSLGPKWALPSSSELATLYNNRNVGELAGSFGPDYHLTSNEFGSGSVFVVDFSVGNGPTPWKGTPYPVRCIRSD